MKNIIGNVVSKPNDKEWLVCCECPSCGAIFTIIMEQNPRAYDAFAGPCPECKTHYDWLKYRISKTKYKFVRAWRGFKQNL